MLKINNNINNVGFGMNSAPVNSIKNNYGFVIKAGEPFKLNPIPKDEYVKEITMNNKENQVKLLNDYVNYNINFDELLQGREKLRNNKEPNDKSVDENIENLFNNFYEDPYYTQTDFSYDARQIIYTYQQEGKYPNIIKE